MIKPIITIALVGVIAVVIYYYVSRFDFSKFSFDKFTVPNPFENLFGTPDNHSSVAGETIELPNGDTIIIPEDNIVNDDGTVQGSPPELILNPDTEDKIKDIIQDNRDSAEESKRIQDKFTKEDETEYLQAVTRIGKELDTPRNDEGFIAKGFRAMQPSNRVAQTVINTKNGRYRNIKTGKTVSYGGYGSAFAQEKALREAYEKNKKLYPEYFKNSPKSKTETTTPPVINQYSRGNKSVSKEERANIKKTLAKQRYTKRNNRRQQEKTKALRNTTDSNTAIEYLRAKIGTRPKRGRRR